MNITMIHLPIIIVMDILQEVAQVVEEQAIVIVVAVLENIGKK